MKNIEDMRWEYLKRSLDETSVDKDPIKEFTKWFEEIVSLEQKDANACTLATCGEDGMPQARVVLLKRYDENGFVFFTNYHSKKANDLKFNPKATLNFFWVELERQVRISGVCEKISTAESLSYFVTRSTGSKLGAWVSKQSKLIESRDMLKLQLAKMKEKFASGDIPLPDFWGGYRLKPQRMEFWQGRESRLHDRILYEKNQNGWKIGRLAP